VVVTVIVVVGRGDRDDRVIIAVIEVFRRRRLVVVTVLVSDAHEAAGLCRIAYAVVARQCRIGTERAGKGGHAIDYF